MPILNPGLNRRMALGPELHVALGAVRHRERRPCRASFWKGKGDIPERDAAIRVDGLRLSFKRDSSVREVLKGVDLRIPRGSFHMLLGANGCGKSTLLRALAGLLTPYAGTTHLDPPYAFVFQNPDHQVVLPTVSSDVAFGLGRYDLSYEQVTAAVQHALDRVGLSAYADRPSSSLSGGQKQRVAIAGALAENPRVLLLDELTTFLDGKDQLNVLKCVRALVDAAQREEINNDINNNSNNNGGSSSGALDNPVTALWVTHRMEELQYADGVSYMEGGKIVWSGTPKEAETYLRKLGAGV